MSIVCPTLTATNVAEFNSQVQELSPTVERVHLDIADGLFAPKLLNIGKVRLPSVVTDIHVMYENPGRVIKKIISLKPHLVIIHYESDANFNEIANSLKSNNIRFGIALLQQTDTSVLTRYKDILDHVLIFSGNLGFFGGHVDMGLVHKVDRIRNLNSNIEIGWDGGINLSNAEILADHHVDVLNVGGYIHKSKDPKQAYAQLVKSLEVLR